MSPTVTPLERLQRTERFIAFVRLGVVIFNATSYLAFAPDVARRPFALATIALASLYSVVTLLWSPALRFTLSYARANTVLDHALIALWIWATGGFASPYFPLFYAETVATVGRFGVMTGVLSGVGSAFLYVAVVALDGGGPVYDLSARVAYMFVLVALVSYVVDVARGSERDAASAEVSAAAFRELARLKEAFVSNVSHELKTPLTAVRGAVSTLLKHEDRFDAAKRRSLLELVERQSERLTWLIHDLLDFSLADQGRLGFQAQEVDIVPLVGRELEDLRLQRSQTIEHDPPRDPIVLRCDAPKIARALRHLIDNASKFSSADSTIRVWIRDEDMRVAVEVADEGRGIDPSQHGRIFDRFYQIDSSLTRDAEGAGVGLAIAREILRLHGGSVEVRSEPGRGSRFSLVLPKQAARSRGLRSA